MDVDYGKLYVDGINLKIEKSETEDVILKKIVRSRGKNHNDAMKRAREVDFEVETSESKIQCHFSFVIK